MSECKETHASFYAAWKGHLNVVKYLAIEKQCDPTSRDTMNNTPLHAAAQKAHAHIVKFLISELNCDANTPGYCGRLPLHYAAYSGCLPLVKYFVEELRCDPQALDNFDCTPLMAAAYSNLPCMQYFVKVTNSHALKAKTVLGKTVFDFATYSNQTEIIDYLINDCGFSPNTPSWMNRIPLHNTAESGRIKPLKHLITKFNCNPKAVDDNGDTPLHCAAAQGYLENVKYLTLDLKCDPSPIDNYGNTPLHDAARNGHLEVVKFLVEDLHCPIDTRGSCHMTPLEWAFFKNQYTVVQYLNMGRQQQYSKHDISEESQCYIAATVLGKHPRQNDSEPSGTVIIDDGIATKKQKMDSNSEEQGPAIESQSTSTAIRLGKHQIQLSSDEGPAEKQQKPNKDS